MKFDEKPVDEGNGESESSEVEITSTKRSPRKILSTSQSSSGDEQTEIDEIGGDTDSAEFSVSSEMNEEMNETPAKEQEKGKKYDREAILNRLADLANLESGKGEIIFDVARMKKSTKPSEILDSEKINAEDRKKLLVEDLRESLEAVPDSILHYMTGLFYVGDCGRPSDQKPDWLDMEKIRRGQKFAQKYTFSIFYAELVSLFALYSFENDLKPLIITGNSTTPHAGFKRYISTANRLYHWYTEDSWTKGTTAYNDIMFVKAVHKLITRKLDGLTNAEIDAATEIPNPSCPLQEIMLKDFLESCEAPAFGQCPYVVTKNNPNRPKGINQTEMAFTQWSFVGLIILNPKGFGIHGATDEDIEAFCHLWRSLGYQLGIEDEYNFYRGTLDEIRQRSHELVETWIKPNFRDITPEWEHMGRSLVMAFGGLVPAMTYEVTLLNLLEIMGLQMPRLYASLSYMNWFSYNVLSSLLSYGTKLPGVTSLLNTVFKLLLNRAANYTDEQHDALRIKLNYHYDKTNRGRKVNSSGPNS